MLKNSMYKSLILIFTCLALLAFSQTAAEDQVHFPIPGYNEHKWFSGTFFFIQVTFLLIWASSITSSSNPKKILTMIPYYYGSTEDQDAAVSLVWSMKMDHSSLNNPDHPNYKSMNTLGTKKPTYFTSHRLEE